MLISDTLIDLLAVYRATRAVVEDSHDMPLLVPLRRAAERVLSDSDWSDVIDCPWCSSLYVALAAAGARRFTPKTWRVASWALAASAIAGLLRQAEVALHAATKAAEAREEAESNVRNLSARVFNQS